VRETREFEIRAPRRIFGPNTDELNRGWRKLHNKKHYKYNNDYEMKKDEEGRKCGMNGEMRNACKLPVWFDTCRAGTKA
jgi:hypothetical protein